MTDVIAWPPVGLVAWEMAWHRPWSRSASLVSGRSYASTAQRARRLVTAHVTGIGADEAGAGYVEMLKALMIDRGTLLVRMSASAAIPHLARTRLGNARVEWLDGATELLWTDGSADLLWFENDRPGVAGTVDGWPALTVSGLPPSRIVIRPGEMVTLIDPATDARQTSRALRVTRSDADGVAVIRLLDAMTGTGQVSLGGAESLVLEADGLPRAVQPATGPWAYEWSFREAFADEVPGGFAEVDPWR